MTETERRDLVSRVLVAAQKSRSNVAEVNHEPAPGEAALIEACIRILNPRRTVEAIDVVNVLALLRRAHGAGLMYEIRFGEEFPLPDQPTIWAESA